MIDPIALKVGVILLSFGSAVEVLRGEKFFAITAMLTALYTQFALL